MRTRAVARHVAAYRSALALLPPEHTNRHGADQARTFGDLLASGTPGVVAWAAAVPDFARTITDSRQPGRNLVYAFARLGTSVAAGALALAGLAMLGASFVVEDVPLRIAPVAAVLALAGIAALTWVTSLLRLPERVERPVVAVFGTFAFLTALAALVANVPTRIASDDTEYWAFTIAGLVGAVGAGVLLVLALHRPRVSPPAANG